MRPIVSRPELDSNTVNAMIEKQLDYCRTNDKLRLEYPNRVGVYRFLRERNASCTALEVRSATDYILLSQGVSIKMHMGNYDDGREATMKRSLNNNLGALGVPKLLSNRNVPYESSEFRHWTVEEWTPDMGIPRAGYEDDCTHLTLLVKPSYRYNGVSFADLDQDTRMQLLRPCVSDARPGQEWGAGIAVTLVWLDSQASEDDLTYGLRVWTNRPEIKLYKDEANLVRDPKVRATYYKQLRQLMEDE